ncbi:MAG: hypothetical protein GX221_08530 [Candidatus Riflebacteria bacterium]|nr:hypothetical protein [Candidatus Riflebacteria bacterium]
MLRTCKRFFKSSQCYLLALMIIVSALSTFSTARADSTITLPLPEGMKADQFTMTLKLPAHTEPIPKSVTEQKALTPRNRIINWNPTPFKKINPKDEMYSVVGRMARKGYITRQISLTKLRSGNMTEYDLVYLMEDLNKNLMKLCQSKNLNKMARNLNITVSDIEDVRRINQNYSGILKNMRVNVDYYDSELLKLQEFLRARKKNILRVIKVEDDADGSTLIHLSVD